MTIGTLPADSPFLARVPGRLMVGVHDGFLTHANYGDIRIGRESRAANFFLDETEGEIAIAISPKEVHRDFPDKAESEIRRMIKAAFDATVGQWVPICHNGAHVYWGTPTEMLGQSKIVFKTAKEVDERDVVNTMFHPLDVADDVAKPPPKRAHGVAFARVTYNGASFDDVDEAQHAAFLDALRVRYDAQPITIDLPMGGSYRTDFFVPSLNAYLEVTKSFPSEDKKYKCEQLAIHAAREAPGRVVFLAFGGVHPPVRQTYATPFESCMQIVRFLAHEIDVGGTARWIPQQDWGYHWVRAHDGSFAIEKMCATQDVRWKDDALIMAYEVANRVGRCS